MTTQSEQTLENNLIAQLSGMGYEKVAVTDESSMLANFANSYMFNRLWLHNTSVNIEPMVT